MSGWIDLILEFLLSAVLWGSLISVVLHRIRSSMIKGFQRVLVTGVFAWIFFHTLLAWYGLFLPVQGQLVQEETGQPIVGARVNANWITYPMSLWKTVCAGQQARVTDANGRFSFPFAPVTTLAFGTMARSAHPRIGGRIVPRRTEIFPWPIFGEIPIRYYKAGLGTSTNDSAAGCHVTLGPKVAFSSIAGERPRFRSLHEEACVAKEPHAQFDYFYYQLIQESSNLARLSIKLQEQAGAIRNGLGGGGTCNGPGICPKPIDPTIAEQICQEVATNVVGSNRRNRVLSN